MDKTKALLHRSIKDERPCLIVERGLLRGHAFPLPGLGKSLSMGRDPGCDIAFDPNVERMVSRRHAEVEVRTNGVYLKDMGSANRTRINGQPVTGEARLKDGDRLELGPDGPLILIRLPAEKSELAGGLASGNLASGAPKSEPALPQTPAGTVVMQGPRKEEPLDILLSPPPELLPSSPSPRAPARAPEPAHEPVHAPTREPVRPRAPEPMREPAPARSRPATTEPMRERVPVSAPPRPEAAPVSGPDLRPAVAPVMTTEPRMASTSTPISRAPSVTASAPPTPPGIEARVKDIWRSGLLPQALLASAAIGLSAVVGVWVGLSG